MPRRDTREKKRRFLDAIERGMTVVAAAEHAGVDRTLPYKWEGADPGFKAQWETARRSRLQALQDTAVDLALAGNVQLLKFLIQRFGGEDEVAAQGVGEVRIIMPGGDDNGSGDPSTDSGHSFISVG